MLERVLVVGTVIGCVGEGISCGMLMGCVGEGIGCGYCDGMCRRGY